MMILMLTRTVINTAGRPLRPRCSAVLCAAAMFNLCGCGTPPQSFESPRAAADSLVAALRADDMVELKRVLGPDSDELLSSGDEVADDQGRAEFLRLYDEKHSFQSEDDGLVMLEVGETNWPLPIPLVKGENGWYFDTAAGLDEVLSRRIGRNELATIQVCLAIVDAQREYASVDHDGDGLLEYATKVRSDEGQKNGLYWPAAPGEPESPMGELVAQAAEAGYAADGTAYYGYRYHILTEQGPAAPGGALNFMAHGNMIGGFGVVAWPAEYGNSGIMTFIVSHHGEVYERDLGNSTNRIARSMRDFNPEAGWTKSDTTDKLSAPAE